MICIFFKKSQIKIPHFFPAPQKLFLLILLKNESLYEVKSLNKKINKNNFSGTGKKWGIFICDFFLKNTDRTCTFIWYFWVVVKLIFGSSLHLYEEKEECFFFAFLKSWFFEGDYALRHESKYGLLLHTISGGVQQQQSFASSWKLQKKNLVGKDSHLHQLSKPLFSAMRCQHSILHAHLTYQQ